MSKMVIYKHQKLNFTNFYGRKCLFATKPSQTTMPKMQFVGGHPDEYCIFLSDLTEKERNSIRNLDRTKLDAAELSNTFRIFIIGSVSDEESLKRAEKFAKEQFKDAIVTKATSQPDKNKNTLILDCYKNIDQCDLLIIVLKKDGTIGEGVLYEKMYAIYTGKAYIEYQAYK